MFTLAIRSVLRRRLRSFLTVGGIAIAVTVLLLIEQLTASYRAKLLKELNSMGMHMMLVPLGCPYDAATRVLKGNSLDTSLPESAVAAAREDPGVEIAAPLLIAAVPRPDQGRTDMFVGLDERGIALKPWWKAAEGSDRFPSEDSVILGADAAQVEARETGDKLYSPETRRTFTVAGILQRTGTSDDNLFFVPLRSAQAMFNASDRLTAVAIRIRDPVEVSEVSTRLQGIPGVQVVTQTEMMGTFLNILGAVRTLMQGIGLVALVASVAGLVNTMFMSVAERASEFSLFRALGASKFQLASVTCLEGLTLTITGIVVGVAATRLIGSSAIRAISSQLPYLPSEAVLIRPVTIGWILLCGTALGMLSCIFPAWRASRAEPARLLKGVD